MLRKNVPERRNQRRQEALARGWRGDKKRPDGTPVRDNPAAYVAEVVQNTASKLS